jgi:hypothetical protein
MVEPLTAEKAAEQEDLFLHAIRGALAETSEIGDRITGKSVSVGRCSLTEHDDGEKIRRMIATLGAHESGLFDRLPRNRRLVWEVRDGLLSRKTRAVIVAAVVNPIGALIRGERVPPRATFADLADVVNEHLSGDGPVRLAGVYSPTGWETDLGIDAIRRPGVGLWLFEPGVAGGFSPAGKRSETPPPPFDIESRQERIEKVVKYVSEHRFDLLMKGIASVEAAGSLDMKPEDVQAGFEEAARRDEFLVLDESVELYIRRA